MTYRYYLRMRPPFIGCFPKLDTLTDVCPFDFLQQTEQGMAWGYVDYSAPLTDKQVYDYELSEGVEL